MPSSRRWPRPRTRRRARAGRVGDEARRRREPCAARARAASPPSRRRSAPARSRARPGGRARGPSDGERDERARRRRVLDLPAKPSGEPEQLREPVERHLLELLQRRGGPPEDPELVQPGDQDLGEDRGLRARHREVREPARVLRVRQPGQEHAVEVASTAANGSGSSGGDAGKRGADLTRLDLGEHRELANPLEIGRDPVDGERAVVPELAHVRSFAMSRQGRVFRICSFVSHARRACATPSSA